MSSFASSALERWMLRSLLRSVGSPPLVFQLWDGNAVCIDSRSPLAQLRIPDRRRLWRLLLDPLYEFGEAYSDGLIIVEGDLVDLLVSIYRGVSHSAGRQSWFTALSHWWHKPRPSSLSASRLNIHQHYDISNDFYKLWLDEGLVYTCAYFSEPAWSLEQAQFAKLEHVCRKLQLKPGQTVFEAGCGWGALALHMARNYGVKVRAFNISREQLALARERAAREGLEDQVEFVEDDWRNIQGKCDAFVSVGMLEHVGLKNFHQLGDVIHACLEPHGRGLIHSIGQNQPAPLDPWTERRIFPGAYPPSLREMLSIFEAHDFSVLDIENLRLHYALTLRHWLERYQQQSDAVLKLFDERFVRMWGLYLAASVAVFETGGLQLFQVVFAHGRDNQLPWNRAFLYQDNAHRSVSEGEPLWKPAMH